MATVALTTAMQSVAREEYTITTDKNGVTTAQATDDMMTLVKRFVTLNARLKELQEEMGEIKAAISETMADQGIDKVTHKGAIRVTRSVSAPERVNTKRLREEYPDVAKMVTEKQAEQTRMTIK